MFVFVSFYVNYLLNNFTAGARSHFSGSPGFFRARCRVLRRPGGSGLMSEDLAEGKLQAREEQWFRLWFEGACFS